MLAVLVIWIVVLAVFGYVYWKPGFKNATELVRFAPGGKARPEGSADVPNQAGAAASVTSTQPS